jgi:hypothetical protein
MTSRSGIPEPVKILPGLRRPITAACFALIMLVFPVFSVAVMEKCCDAYGDGEYYFRSGCSASEGAGVLGGSIAVEHQERPQFVQTNKANDCLVTD